MRTAVEQCRREINDLVAADPTGPRSLPDALIDSGREFLGNDAADRLVEEVIAFSGLCGGELNGDLSILAVAAELVVQA